MTVIQLSRRERTPDRPGPGPLRDGQLRTLDLTVRRRVDSLLLGDYRALRSGDGTELAQVRPYVVGDDVRKIDWNVTARTGDPHVRAHVAEHAVNVWLLLDGSASMTFGTADRRKWDVAEGVALAVGHVAARRGNRLAVATFGGVDTRSSSPTGTAAAACSGCSTRCGGSPRTRRSEPPRSVTPATVRLGWCARRSLIVAVSDFRGPRDWSKHLLRLAARHDVVAVEIRDRREQELPNVGTVWLVDPETREQLQVDTRDARLRARFAESAAAERLDVARAFRSAGVPHVVVSTSGDWLRTLVRFLQLEKVRR